MSVGRFGSSREIGVVARGLAHRFPGTKELFSGLDITLSPGEVVAVVGPSGSGKSTLLSILAGWVKPLVGEVTWHRISHTGWVFQNPHGVPRRTALDHVVLPLLAQGLARQDAEHEAMKVMIHFGLAEVAERVFRDLSGGEAQRLMLARALVAKCDLLLVDEPTAQLDLATASTVNDVLMGIAQDDTIVVVATHDLRTKDACTRVIDLADYQGVVSSAKNQRSTYRPTVVFCDDTGIETRFSSSDEKIGSGEQNSDEESFVGIKKPLGVLSSGGPSERVRIRIERARQVPRSNDEGVSCPQG